MTSLRPRTALALAAALLALGALGAPAAARAEDPKDFKVVVHAENPAVEIERDLLSRLFLKKALRWPDGVAAQPVEPAPGRLREAFAGQVHRKSANAVKSYWTQLIFSGRDVPPLERPGDAEVLAFVRANRGAVGYVAAAADTAGVKVLAVKPSP